MGEAAKRATIYFEPELRKAIRLNATDNRRSISDVVSRADNLRPPGREMLSAEE